MKRAAAKPAHSPGPWTKAERLNGPWWHISATHTVNGERCIGGRQAIAAVHGASKKGSIDYAEMFEANARLIAAAPDLLEALKEIDGRLLRCCAAGASASEAYDSFYQDVVQAAITKATGGAA